MTDASTTLPGNPHAFDAGASPTANDAQPAALLAVAYELRTLSMLTLLQASPNLEHGLLNGIRDRFGLPPYEARPTAPLPEDGTEPW